MQTAINLAQTGNTVVIPAGTCNWTGSVLWAAPANVTLMGAGTSATGGGGQTVITDNFAGGSPVININTNAVGTFRLSGITLRGGTGSIKESGMLAIGGRSSQVRIDHIHIDKTTYSPESTRGSASTVSITPGI